MDYETPKENDKCKENDFGRRSVNKIFQSFASQQSAIDKAMAAIARPSAMEKALQSFASQQSAMDKAMAAMVRPSAIEKALQSFTWQQSAIDKVIAAVSKPLALDKALQSFASQQSVIEKAMVGLAGSSNLEHAINSFATASSSFLADPSYLSKMAKAISAVDLDSINISNIERELENTESEFSSMENRADSIRVFSRLPSFIQVILFAFFINVFLPQINSISANLITPLVESYLENSEETDRQKIKEIKKIPLIVEEIDTTDLRFITANNVRLRANPSTKSEIYDELALGQVVTVLTKKRNWIEIIYYYEDGESMSGWVFTRYTAKFVK